MKKITCIMATLICCCFASAQKKHAISIEQGFTFTQMGSQLMEYMVANGFNASHSNYPVDWLFGDAQYPSQEKNIINYRIRYSYRRNQKTSIEAGFGHIFRTTVTGLNSNGNYYDIKINTATIYAAYQVKNKKENLAIGIGPALTICHIVQQSSATEKSKSDNTQLLPGANITAFWYFVNQKNWFMGFRTDMSVTARAKIEPISTTNYQGSSNGTNAGSVSSIMNTISFTTGIKF